MPLKPNNKLGTQLHQGLVQLRLPTHALLEEKLIAYMALLSQWNKISNLTAIHDAEKILSHHILDSLAVQPYLQGPTLLDVGTGAGLPGIPLSLANPDWQFVLLDSQQKKLRFVRQCVLELQLKNVQIECVRLEKYAQRQKFATVIARAFAPLAKLIPQCLPFCSEQGQLIAMLGKRPDLAQIPNFGMEYAILPIEVPGLDAQRHILRLTRRN